MGGPDHVSAPGWGLRGHVQQDPQRRVQLLTCTCKSESGQEFAVANAGIHNLHPYPCTSVMFSPRGEGEALCGLNQAGMALMTGHGSFPMPCMFPECGKRGKHTWRGSSHKSQLALGSLLPRQFHLKFGRAALKRIGSEPLVRALACSKKRPTGCKNSHSPHPAETIGNHFGFTSPSGFGKVLLAAGNQF